MNTEVEKAYKFFNKYPGHLKTSKVTIAERLDITEESITEAKKVIRNESRDAGEDVEQSYEEFLEEHGIDEDQVSLTWYKGKHFSVAEKPEKPSFNPVEAFKEAIKEYSPPSYSDTFDHSTRILKNRAGMINLFDAHIDKICSTKDTDEEANIDSNINDFERGFDEILSSIEEKKPEIIYFPVGNDFFHTNDFTLTTKKGTRQDDKVHVTGHEAFRIGLNLLRRCIDKARQVAPVKIIPVRGNHDEDRIRYLLECLLIAYENQEDVSIVDTHRPRIYLRYGTWLFGFAHGDKGIKPKDYPSYMTTDKEGKKHWSEIDQGIFFLGHYHHEKRYQTMKNQDFKGCTVHFLRATTGTDSWHWEEGWTGVPRTAYGFVFDKNGEQEQEFKINL